MPILRNRRIHLMRPPSLTSLPPNPKNRTSRTRLTLTLTLFSHTLTQVAHHNTPSAAVASYSAAEDSHYYFPYSPDCSTPAVLAPEQTLDIEIDSVYHQQQHKAAHHHVLRLTPVNTSDTLQADARDNIPAMEQQTLDTLNLISPLLLLC